MNFNKVMDAQRQLPDRELSQVASRSRIITILFCPLDYSSGDPRKRGNT
jgi:hypothetical protein